MNNQSGLSFTNISSEEFREYRFPSGEVVRIDSPTDLNVSEHGHRVFDAAGLSHYIPLGWVHLQWKAKEGQPNFVK